MQWGKHFYSLNPTFYSSCSRENIFIFSTPHAHWTQLSTPHAVGKTFLLIEPNFLLLMQWGKHFYSLNPTFYSSCSGENIFTHWTQLSTPHAVGKTFLLIEPNFLLLMQWGKHFYSLNPTFYSSCSGENIFTHWTQLSTPHAVGKTFLLIEPNFLLLMQWGKHFYSLNPTFYSSCSRENIFTHWTHWTQLSTPHAVGKTFLLIEPNFLLLMQ